MANRISTTFDFAERGSGLKKIKADVQGVDGAFNKVKASAKGAFDSVKQYGPEAALIVGGSVATAVYKAGQEFADAAIAAGQFADATGLSTEQASQWISVADDLGLNANDVQRAFLRLNREIGEGDGVAAEYGLQLQRTADGAADVNATMLETIGVVNGIKDPTERARVAQELFGRSYANVAELIFDDASKVAAALQSTSDAQTFDAEEVKKARAYRAAMDQLNDVMTDLKMTVGEEVVPALSDTAETLAGVAQAVNNLPELPGWLRESFEIANPFLDPLGPVKRLGGAVGLFNNDSRETSAIIDEMVVSLKAQASTAAIVAAETLQSRQASTLNSEAMRDEAKAASHVATVMADVERRQADAAAATERHRQAMSDLFDEVQNNVTSMFDYEDATLALQNAAEDYTAQLEAEASSTEQSDRTKRDLRQTEIDLANQALETARAYAQNQGAIEGTTAFAILQRQELERLSGQFPELRDEIAQFISELNRIPAVKTVSLILQRNSVNSALSRTTGVKARVDEFGNLRQFDAGGVVPGPRGAAQLAVVHGGETILPTHKSPLPRGMASGVVINGGINVQAPAGANADEFGRLVREAIRRETRWSGPVSGWSAA